MFAFAEYDTAVVNLAPGERVIAFTDGITEAANRVYELWGEERLLELLQGRAGEPIEELVKAVAAAATAFADGAPQSDDMTVLGIGLRNGN